MRKLITILFFFIHTFLFGTNRYFSSSSGNDITGNGTLAFPYASLQKLSTVLGGYPSGDSILFKRGDTFYGNITNLKAGMNYSAYGTGAKPIITGLSTVTGWVNIGGNLWEAPVTNVAANVNLVIRNGVIQQIGRFPNAGIANGGYLTLTASTYTSVTGPALSTTTNWTGSELVVKVRRWDITRAIVTNHSGGVVTVGSNLPYIPTLGFGYFFQRDSRTLDVNGEWWYNSAASKLRVFSTVNPSTFTYQIATQDRLFSSVYGTLSVGNLSFYGCDKKAIFQNGGSFFKFYNCDINYSGAEAITVNSAENITVTGFNINNTLGSGIRVYAQYTGPKNLYVNNNVIDSTCLIAGMEISDGINGSPALLCNGGDNVYVDHNRVTYSGYNGIQWQGNNVYVRNNFVDSFCMVRDDGAGIYVVENVNNLLIPIRTNRNVISNIVLKGVGTTDGTSGTGTFESSCNGLYFDLGSRTIVADSNTIAYIPGNGVHGNNDSNITMRNNTFFSGVVGFSFQRFQGASLMRSFTLKKNIYYPYRFRYRNLAINQPTLLTKEQDIALMGVLDSNYYSLRPGTDTSLTAITQWQPGSTNTQDTKNNFPYLTGTIGIETHSINVANTGYLEYNASNVNRKVYFAGLSKKDPKGNIYNDSVTIPPWDSRILIPNGTTQTPPTANAGVDKNITLPTNSVSVTGVGTNGSGSSRTTIWSQISGPNTATNSAPTNVTTIFGGLIAGTYVMKFKVTNNLGDTAIDFMTITVNAGNVSPTANAGVDQSITLPTTTTTLIGSGTDVDGTIASYLWTKVSGPTGGTITSPSSQNTGITALQQGTYVYSLLVTDNLGATGSDFMQVIVNAANVAPTADAGPCQVVTLPVNTATLTGSGTDPDGTIASYAWVKISGPTGGAISSPSSATTNVTGLTVGLYVYQLTVTDNGGLTASSVTQVTVNPAVIPPNIPPTANAGSDQNITLPTSTVTVNGTASTDPDGTIVGYKWTKTSGPSGGTIVSSTSAITNITGLTAGTYIFNLRVTDNSGDTATDAMQVIVSAANIPPTANAGANQSITLPTNSATLTGSGTDPDGTIIGYSWVKISGPTGGAITSPANATTTVTGLTQGTYTYQLTVTDNKGLTGSAITQIIVNPAIPPVNQPPVANAGADQNITYPTNSVTVNGTGSSDPDGTIVAYLWRKVNGPGSGTIVSPTSAITNINSLIPGLYVFSLRVTDNNGDTALDAMQVRVNPANVPPTANAGANQVITLPVNSVTLVGSGTDPDGTIVSYAWIKVSGPTGGAITSPSSSTTGVTGLTQGSYIYQLTVTDNGGLTGTSLTQITVNPVVVPPNIKPISEPGNDQNITLPTNSVNVDGSASTDPDGTIVAYLWTKTNGPVGGTITSPTSVTTSITGLTAGVYIFNLRVTDNSGDTATNIMQVTVNAANQIPVVNAGTDQTVTLPTNSTTLMGNASDPDGTITAFLWTKLSGPTGGTITSSTSANTGITGLTAGVYLYQLRATDNSGDTATDAVQITVNAANVPPTANAGVDQTLTLPTNSTTVNGSGSTDPEAPITGYLWTQLSGPSTALISNPSSVTTTISGMIEGAYVFRLRVTDAVGDTAIDAMQITVVQPVVPPSANPDTNRVIYLPTNSTTLNGVGTAYFGATITGYAWTDVAGNPSTGTIQSPTSATTNVTGLIAGLYFFRLTVTDSNGNTGTNTVRVDVIPIPPVRVGVLLRGYRFP